MARLTLSKSALSHQQKQLQSFKRFLPSLDLKRKQLIAERSKARSRLQATRQQIETLQSAVAEALPMLANQRVDLRQLARISAVDIVEENVMGLRLPKIAAIRVDIRPYGLLAKPHWVDRLADALRQALELRVQLQVDTQRLTRLEQAVQVITQRVNLFDKVLIPRAQANIKRIEIHLADRQRAAVVRAKLAKSKNRRTAETWQ